LTGPNPAILDVLSSKSSKGFRSYKNKVFFKEKAKFHLNSLKVLERVGKEDSIFQRKG
jgi:hypothetical protein